MSGSKVTAIVSTSALNLLHTVLFQLKSMRKESSWACDSRKGGRKHFLAAFSETGDSFISTLVAIWNLNHISELLVLCYVKSVSPSCMVDSSFVCFVYDRVWVI